MKEVIEEIKIFFSGNHIPVFGIAKAASLEKEPIPTTIHNEING